MRRRVRALGAVGVVAITILIGGVVATSGAAPVTPSAQPPTAKTVSVQRGRLSNVVSAIGSLTFQAGPDGVPYSALNWARGVYTDLPLRGDRVACGDVLYRVNERPVLLLCGPVPAYRTLELGDVGGDVRELNGTLHALGDDARFEINPDDTAFTAGTVSALQELQRHAGLPVTGTLGLGDAVFLPGPVRIGKVSAELGGVAEPAAALLDATSPAPEVVVDLDAAQQGEVRAGDAAQITLPGNSVVKGQVARLGNVVVSDAGQGGSAQVATFPVYVSLDNSGAASGFDGAPVQVSIATTGVDNALSVPVLALIGRPGGGFAVEVVRGDGQHELVPVTLGLFDTSAGRVQVEGALVEGDQVVVPSP